MTRQTMSPPAWAEHLLLALLPGDRAESDSGDFLEMYRDEQLPARGRRGADRWYWRQVALVFAHTYGPWLLALIALFVIGDVSNTYRVPMPTRITPAIAVSLIIGASVHGGWRSATVRGGLLAGSATATLLWLFMAGWWMTTWYAFAQVQQTEPYWIQAWQSSAAPGETFGHWIFWDNVGATVISGLVLNASGLAIGLLGGVSGSCGRKVATRR